MRIRGTVAAKFLSVFVNTAVIDRAIAARLG
jgi:hypothetical protein